VTLNKMCGQIIMHNQSLSAGASAFFNLTNSQIAAKDLVHIVHAGQDGGTAGSYRAQITSVFTGGCGIMVTNASGGALGEAVALNFAVIKGAAS
jgi:hypothetical protein